MIFQSNGYKKGKDGKGLIGEKRFQAERACPTFSNWKEFQPHGLF